MTIWLSPDVIDQWHESDRVYDGMGTPNLYSDLAILVTHEIRQVFKLPLRQYRVFQHIWRNPPSFFGEITMSALEKRSWNVSK